MIKKRTEYDFQQIIPTAFTYGTGELTKACASYYFFLCMRAQLCLVRIIWQPHTTSLSTWCGFWQRRAPCACCVWTDILWPSTTLCSGNILPHCLRCASHRLIDHHACSCLTRMALIILSMLIFDCCIMLYLEKPDLVLPFHSWIYYAWVTTATVGYGDISPITPRGRYFFM